MELLIPVILILVGLMLVGIEVYIIPGLNVVGIIGFLVMVFGIGYAFTVQGALSGMLALTGTLALGGGMGFAMWKSGAWDKFVLSTQLPNERLLSESTQAQRGQFLGKMGTALTPLRPTGVAKIEDERVEVVTEGSYIAAGSEIQVVALDRRRVFVRLADEVSGT